MRSSASRRLRPAHSSFGPGTPPPPGAEKCMAVRKAAYILRRLRSATMRTKVGNKIGAAACEEKQDEDLRPAPAVGSVFPEFSPNRV